MSRAKGIKNINAVLVVYNSTPECKGSWIRPNCIVCNKELCYWSKTGKPLERYKFPRCEEHK